MKREQRRPWLEIDPRYILCSWCRFSVAQEDYIDCGHPLWAVADSVEPMEPGDDCWGFRPEKGLTLEGAMERVRQWEMERDD